MATSHVILELTNAYYQSANRQGQGVASTVSVVLI